MLALTVLNGCGTSEHVVNYETSGNLSGGSCDLDVYSEGITVSENYKIIGEISIRDSGFSTNCGQEAVMSKIKSAACGAKADAFQMFNVQHPIWYGSTCFQASARFLKYPE
tara:strand:- start:211 stop:543 length:333 start_codon:yes stop_codon:yes gene_type:complete